MKSRLWALNQITSGRRPVGVVDEIVDPSLTGSKVIFRHIGGGIRPAFCRTVTSSPKTGPEKFEFSGGRSSPKKEENRDEKETQ